MRRKKERPLTRPADWEKSTDPAAGKESDNPAPLAPGYAGPNPSEFPALGGKEGPTVSDHQPFPLCIGLAPDPNQDNQESFNDSLCLRFLSDLHKLILDQRRIQDLVQTLAGLRENPSNRSSNPISEPTLRRQLAKSANQWATQKFGPSGPKVDTGTLQRLFTMLHAVYNFTGRVNEVMKQICGSSRHYHPWYKRYPLVCTQENCTAVFDSTNDFANHLQQNHPNLPKPSSFIQFRCSFCDLSISNAEKEIRAHLKTHQLSMTRYAFLKLTNTKDLFTAPSKDYWTLTEGDDLFVNIQNFPPSSAQLQSATASTKTPVRVSPTTTTNPSGSECKTSQSDPLNDLLSAPEDETMDSNYENDQEFQCLFNNPILPLNNSDTFSGETLSPTPAPSSSAPPAGPGLWSHTPLNDLPVSNTLNGILSGPPSASGPNSGTVVHFHAPPTMSQSARVPGQMEQNLTNATISVHLLIL